MTYLGRGAAIGDYKIDREVSHDRTASLFEATHAQLGRRVAIKLMAPTHAQLRGARAQFVREAHVLDRLRHAGVARVYDCGVLADGRAWFAVDRAAGRSLAHVIASGARIDPLRVILDVAAILEHAHAHGFAHRNLRADAITCGTDPRGPALRIAHTAPPFGSAADEVQALVVGDWSHARELALAPHAAAADVHALGVIAFQVLSGVMAFGSGSAALQPGASAATRFPRASRLLTALVDRMLARDVRARPSIGEVREAAAALVVGQLRYDGGGLHTAGSAAEWRCGSIDDSVRDDLDVGEMTRIQQMPVAPPARYATGQRAAAR